MKTLINLNYWIKVYLSKKKVFFPILLSIVLLSGCSKYQYLNISSHLYQNQNKEFIDENDTVMIKYSFAGKNFPLTISIYNKLQQPIFIDWEKTTVIVNNLQLNEPFNNDQQVTNFIAPLSYVTIVSKLSHNFILLNSRDSVSNVILGTSNGSNPLKMHFFNEETTPFNFRSILTISTKEFYTSAMYFDDSFWVSNIFQTRASPSSITYKSSNQSFIEKTNATGAILGLFLFSGICLWIGASGG